MSCAGGRVARDEAGWRYSAKDCEAWPLSLFTGYTSHLPWVCLVSGSTLHKRRTVQPPEGPIAWRLPPRRHGRERGNCVRHRIYLPAHSDGRTTTPSPTGADLLLSIVCSPPTLADEFGCLRRGNKAALINRLGIKLSWPRSPDIVIVDGQQLLYHVTWPCGGDPSVLVASMKARLASLPGECVLVFDHERMRHAVNYNLAINSPIPSRDAILKNKHNKRQLSRVLSTFDMGAAVIIDTQDTGALGHEEADVTIISYVLQAVGEGKNVVRVFCDDTDVFVLLVFWMWRNQLVDTCQMQIERWDGTVPDINQTCIKLGSKMPPVAWNARLNWLRHYILPIQ